MRNVLCRVRAICAGACASFRRKVCTAKSHRLKPEAFANPSLVMELEKRLLELVARGTSLNELLDKITRSIEGMAPQCVCTILLLDEEEGRFLRNGSGPSLPADYMNSLNGLEIGPNVGACGSAAFRKTTVIVEDIATDYRFALAKDHVLSYGLRSCWSVPICNFNNVVVGTFAMYHRQPAKPGPEELQLVEAGARLAGNVIERLRTEQRLREIAERLDVAEKAAAFGIWEVSFPSGSVSVSEGFASLIGLQDGSRQLNLRELETMLHAADRTAVLNAAEEAIESEIFQAEFRIVLPDGSVRWERGQGRIQLAGGQLSRATGALIDVTEEKHLLMRLEEARAAAETSASAAREAEHLEQDRKMILEMVAKDQPLERILPVLACAVSSHLPLSVCSIQLELPDMGRISASPRLPEPIARALARIPVASARQTLSAAPITELSGDPWWQQCAGSTRFPQQNYIAAPVLQNRNVTGLIIAFSTPERCVSPAEGELLESWARFASLAVERRGLYEQLSFRAQYDEMTGLLNRTSLYERMDAQVSAGIHEGNEMAVIYFDLDGFKEINDLHGHAAGDEVLRRVSRRIAGRIRRTDIAARMGGDEFVVLLPGVCDRSEANRIVELVRSGIDEPITFEGLTLHVGASAGIAICPDDARKADALLKIADADMYREKSGRQSRVARNRSHNAEGVAPEAVAQ
jgi:diguanylate cyclase (GGDEF)-like protein